MVEVEILSSSQPCHLEFFIYFWIENLAYLYPHRGSQITHLSFVYLTEAVLICRNSQAYLLCIYCLGQNGIRGEECHTLRSKTLKIKTCQLLLAYCLLEGPWAIIFFLPYIFLSSHFFSGGYWGTPNSTSGHLSIFLRGCRALAPFYFLEIYFCIAHASNAIILRKSESFWIKMSWSWEHDKSLNKGLTRFAQTQYKAN
jgi:hypothetical protein